MNRAVDHPVYHDVRGMDLAVDAGIGRHDQGAGIVRQRGDVTPHHAVHAQAAAEHHIALDARRRADQAVDPVLRLAIRLLEHVHSPYMVTVCVARGWLEPVSYTRTWTFSTFAFGLTRKVPSTRRKYLNASRKLAASAASGKLIIAFWPPSFRETTSSRRPL